MLRFSEGQLNPVPIVFSGQHPPGRDIIKSGCNYFTSCAAMGIVHTLSDAHKELPNPSSQRVTHSTTSDLVCSVCKSGRVRGLL